MIWLFLAGWLQVALVAANVVQVANGHYWRAAVTGFAISVVWWSNAHTAGVSGGWGEGMVYALGASAGTLTGMWVGRR